MKIIVTAETTDTFLPVSNITFPVIQEYCDRHGYEFRPKHITEPVRSVVWDRVITLQEALKDCDWAVHVDADWMPTNLRVPLESFMDNHKNIVISRATNESGEHVMNDGFLAVRDSIWGNGILAWCWKHFNKPEQRLFCLQDSLQWIHRYGPEEDRIKFQVTHQCLCNSFDYPSYGLPDSTEGQWRRGNLSIHLPGMSNERRVEILNQHLPEIIR